MSTQRIIVCIKQVPNVNNIVVNTLTNTLERETVENILNPFDLHAIEEAVRLKESFHFDTLGLSMGPPFAARVLQEAIAMGIDEGILITDSLYRGSDTWATSYILSRAIKKIAEFDVIICGKQSTDGDTAHIGPSIASHLGIPHITQVQKIIEVSGSRLVLTRVSDDAYETLEVILPALITVTREINTPRFASLKGRLSAKKKTFQQWNNEVLHIDETLIGIKGSPTKIRKIYKAYDKKRCCFFTGNVKQQVRACTNILVNVREIPGRDNPLMTKNTTE